MAKWSVSYWSHYHYNSIRSLLLCILIFCFVFSFLPSFTTKTWSLENRKSFSIFCFDVTIPDPSLVHFLWLLYPIVFKNIKLILLSLYIVKDEFRQNIIFAFMVSSFGWMNEFSLVIWVTVKIWKEAWKLYSAVLTWKVHCLSNYVDSSGCYLLIFPVVTQSYMDQVNMWMNE